MRLTRARATINKLTNARCPECSQTRQSWKQSQAFVSVMLATTAISHSACVCDLKVARNDRATTKANPGGSARQPPGSRRPTELGSWAGAAAAIKRCVGPNEKAARNARAASKNLPACWSGYFRVAFNRTPIDRKRLHSIPHTCGRLGGHGA
jgi:hypothetical protein